VNATTKMDRPLYRRLMHALWQALRDDRHWTRPGAAAVVFAGLEVAVIFSVEVLQWDRAELMRACSEMYEVVSKHVPKCTAPVAPGAN